MKHFTTSGGIWLSLPALVLAFLYSFKEAGLIIINILYAATALGFSIIGSHFGEKLSKSKRH